MVISAKRGFATAFRSTTSPARRNPPARAHDPAVWMNAESKRRGIKQHYEFVVRSIEPEKKVVQGLYNYNIPYDLLVMVPPHRPAQVLLDSGLADERASVSASTTTRCKPNGTMSTPSAIAPTCRRRKQAAWPTRKRMCWRIISAVEITGKGRPVDLWLHTI